MISGSEKYSFKLFLATKYFSGLEILMSGIFLSLNFQACVFFLGLQNEAPSEPLSCILRVPLWGTCTITK